MNTAVGWASNACRAYRGLLYNRVKSNESMKDSKFTPADVNSKAKFLLLW